jgi:mono/diheme cytochrome c family protein
MRPIIECRAFLLGCALMLAAAFAIAQSRPQGPGECPQPRFTGKAPDEYYTRTNPLLPGTFDQRRAERLYQGKPDKISCASCHGAKGDGKGEMASMFDPPPRNFACARTVNDVPDGQLFWIVRFGSPETSMPPHPGLSDEEIWQIVQYLRRLAR